MPEFKDFTLALFNDWVSLMSGIASVVLLIVGFVKRWDAVPRWAVIAAAAICFFFAAARVWTTEHNIRIEKEAQVKSLIDTNRPVLQVLELSPEQIRNYAMGDSRNVIRPPSDYLPAYTFAEDSKSNKEALFYRVKNTGKSTARNLDRQVTAEIVDGDKSSPVELDKPTQAKQQQVLLPDQVITQQAILPIGTAYSGKGKNSGDLRITVMVTYTGVEEDPKKYFYKIVFKINRYKHVESLPRGGGGVSVESTDEGVYKESKQQ